MKHRASMGPLLQPTSGLQTQAGPDYHWSAEDLETSECVCRRVEKSFEDSISCPFLTVSVVLLVSMYGVIPGNDTSGLSLR